MKKLTVCVRRWRDIQLVFEIVRMFKIDTFLVGAIHAGSKTAVISIRVNGQTSKKSLLVRASGELQGEDLI